MILYGIPNCDTVKKARLWLQAAQITYTFHDFKKESPTAEILQRWLNQHSWEALINKRGTTWRKLPVTEQNLIVDQDQAIAVMIQYPSLIKRPILETDTDIYIGFDLTTYKALLL